MSLLQGAVEAIKTDLEQTIRTAHYNGQAYEDGLRAKEALIRSQSLIIRIHEAAKVSICQELERVTRKFTIHPPLGERGPEVAISGYIKRKRQDIVVLFGETGLIPEVITQGPLAGSINSIGRERSESAIVIGVRSQLSSVGKNFDTLMERAFAETLNLRLRLPRLVMGEVYLLPVVEYDDQAMKANRIAWKRGYTPVEKFIRTFLGITHRDTGAVTEDPYKYERSALILVDFRQSPPMIFSTLEELKEAGCISPGFTGDFGLLTPTDFANDIVSTHRERHLYLY
ncbi:MAG: hypothetical protein OXG13_08830 [Gemmatimonadaceae bacterium]|nr:hypothetical protein [Gemmatimonadaceae bacterium]